MATQSPTPAIEPSKTSIADWAGTEDDDLEYYVGEKRQRGGRKKRKKNRQPQEVEIDWDEIYDPLKPTIYAAYMKSEERVRDIRDWKDRLYAHMRNREPSMDSEDDDYYRPKNGMAVLIPASYTMSSDMNFADKFAPPSSFAPPPNLNQYPSPGQAAVPDDATGDDAFARRARINANVDTEMSDYSEIPPPPPEEPAAPPPNDVSGEDAYLRRLQKSQDGASAPPSFRPLDAFQPAAATISRAPVRYTLPPPPEDIPASEAELEAVFAKEQAADTETEPETGEDAPRSLRPGQKGFAERLLSKYGWTKGSGLGATGSGIVNPLQAKVQKQKKRPDSEGGGFATAPGRGKIIGGKKKGGEDAGKFGPMSEVIVLRGMLDGLDLESELESGNLMQEIGEECSDKVCFASHSKNCGRG